MCLQQGTAKIFARTKTDWIETWIDALLRVPPMATTTPRKLKSEGGEEIEETPSDDDVVIDRH